MANSRVVRTRHVTITSPEGERLKRPMWGKAKRWAKSRDILTNLRQAINYARKVMDKKRLGTVVYIGDVPIYHCKWGGGRVFAGWKANPAAGYWRRKVSGS